jgi:hypothetical protein
MKNYTNQPKRKSKVRENNKNLRKKTLSSSIGVFFGVLTSARLALFLNEQFNEVNELKIEQKIKLFK